MGISRKQVIMLVVLISGTFITILNQTLVNPALPSIMGDLNVTASTVQWLTTGFTMVNAVMIPVTAFLTDRFKTKQLFIASMSVFTAGSLLCGLAPNFALLLAGRLVQAAAAGVLMPMVMTVMLLTFPTEKRGMAMGIFGIIVMVAPAFGPTAAGAVVDNWGWQLMFVAVAALAFIDVLVAVFTLPQEEKVVPDNLTLDKLSVVLSTFGFGGLLFGFSVIGNSGVSAPAIAGVLVGAASLTLFIRRQLKLDVPMLDMRVLKNRKFTVGTIVGMVIQAAIMANGVLIPIYIQTLCGYSATVSGIVMMPGALIMMAMSPIAGRLFDKHGPRTMAVIGTILLSIGTIFMCMLTTSTSMVVFACVIAFRNFAMSLVNMPINTWALNALDNSVINHGNAVNNTFKQVAGSLGGAIVISVYSLVSAANTEALGTTEACMLGINVAFGTQLVLIIAATLLVIFMVKDKAKDAANQYSADSNKVAVEQLMQRDVYTVNENTSVADAIAMLVDKGISACPVLDADGKPVGFLSDGDVVRVLGKNATNMVNLDPISSILLSARVPEDVIEKVDHIMDSPVSSIAHHGCTTVDVHCSLDEICRVLGENHLKKVPVVEDGRLVGVLNRSDITQAAMRSYLERQSARSSL